MLETINNKLVNKKPIWLMRQAGRYLPEYREVRSKFKSFIEFCLTPEAACEVTIQPLRRFSLDAAIIFSDILIIPYALGFEVDFKENFGPILKAKNGLRNISFVDKEPLYLVGEAIRLVKNELYSHFPKVNLIGFAGSPFTVASYMIEEGSSKDFKKTLRFIHEQQELFTKIVDNIVNTTIEYIKIQIKSGAQIIKTFDSWAGVLSEDLFERWVVNPNRRIISSIKSEFPEIPVISFPRGIGTKLKSYVKKTNVDCIAIDQYTPMTWVKENIGHNTVLQGNMDNFLLAFGSKLEIKKQAIEILNSAKNCPHIFNLGHGIIPETPIDNVKFIVDTVKEYGNS